MKFFKRAGYPLKFFLLDILAAPFVLISVLKLAGNMDIIPATMQFKNYGWYAVTMGIIFLMPGFIFTIFKGKNKNRGLAQEKNDDKAL